MDGDNQGHRRGIRGPLGTFTRALGLKKFRFPLYAFQLSALLTSNPPFSSIDPLFCKYALCVPRKIPWT